MTPFAWFPHPFVPNKIFVGLVVTVLKERAGRDDGTILLVGITFISTDELGHMRGFQGQAVNNYRFLQDKFRQ